MEAHRAPKKRYSKPALLNNGLATGNRRYTRAGDQGTVSKSPSRQPLMNRINWGEPACSEKSVCRTSREVRKANDTREVVRPHSTCEAWNLAKYLHSRGIAWDSVEGRRRRRLPQNRLPHVTKSDKETFALHRD